MTFSVVVSDLLTSTDIPKPVSDERTIDIINFVNSLSYHTNEKPEKMTISDAAYTMMQWIVDGVEVPEGLTPANLAYWWNQSIVEAERWADLDLSDDSDDI